MTSITENLQRVRDQITNATIKTGRTPEDICLVAVSKRHSVSAIEAAYRAGQRDFGENFVQEALAKMDEINHPDIVWHFIGAIQSNKTSDIAANFDWVHTIDRLQVAQRLHDQRPPDAPPLNVCLQVNIDAEPQKSGVAVAEALALAQQIAELANLRLRGLMCLPKLTKDEAEQSGALARMAELFKSLNEEGLALDTLSMGMSADLEQAIEHGATTLRIGTAIFGARP